MTAFRCFMVATDVGTNRKLRRLPVVERWTYVAGVLALAAQSPMRGALLVAENVPVTPEDVALQANVSVRHARSTLDGLRALGMLERDDLGVEWVHDWPRYNPDPRPSETPEAWRERKRAQRQRDAESRPVTRDVRVTPPASHEGEGEGEGEELPPLPPTGGAPFPVRLPGKRTRDRAVYDRRVAEFAADLFPDAAPERRHGAVTQALGAGARNRAEVERFVRRWDLLPLPGPTYAHPITPRNP